MHRTFGGILHDVHNSASVRYNRCRGDSKDVGFQLTSMFCIDKEIIGLADILVQMEFVGECFIGFRLQPVSNEIKGAKEDHSGITCIALILECLIASCLAV